MRVENVYPDYKDALERKKSIQEVYTELQLIFYNRSRKTPADHEKIIEFKKGN